MILEDTIPLFETELDTDIISPLNNLKTSTIKARIFYSVISLRQCHQHSTLSVDKSFLCS